LDQFVASRKAAPAELVLDVDATHVPLHGQQKRAHFNAHYDNHCYLPLYVFCGQDMLAFVLRPSWRDPASIVSAVLKLLARRLRQAWPRVRLVVRGDSGFSQAKVLRRLEAWGIDYVLGVQKNPVLEWNCALAARAVAERHAANGAKERLIGEFSSSLSGDASELYERLCCARGEAENRIKEAQLDLFGRRASCHRCAANQMRRLLAALAYTLMINLRRLALVGTELQQACTVTIRTPLLKIGAAVLRNTRRVRRMLASQHPLRQVFEVAAARLAPVP
jgi:hypothetical protein